MVSPPPSLFIIISFPICLCWRTEHNVFNEISRQKLTSQNTFLSLIVPFHPILSYAYLAVLSAVLLMSLPPSATPCHERLDVSAEALRVYHLLASPVSVLYCVRLWIDHAHVFPWNVIVSLSRNKTRCRKMIHHQCKSV